MTDTKILDKLGKIKAHMESAQAIGSEQEAQAFAAMLQTLLAKHKLEMTDLQYSQHLQDEPVEETRVGEGIQYKDGKRVYVKYPDVEVSRKRTEWIERLARVIAEAHSCEILVSTGGGLWFVGRKSDTQVAEYLFITMLRTAEKLSHKAYKKLRAQCRARDNGGGAFLSETYGFKDSFLVGFTTRLMQRFEEEKRKIEHDTTGTAMIRLNKEAVAVRNYIDQNRTKKAKSIGGRSDFNAEGYKRGKETADGLRIDSNAVTSSQANKQIRE